MRHVARILERWDFIRKTLREEIIWETRSRWHGNKKQILEKSVRLPTKDSARVPHAKFILELCLTNKHWEGYSVFSRVFFPLLSKIIHYSVISAIKIDIISTQKRQDIVKWQSKESKYIIFRISTSILNERDHNLFLWIKIFITSSQK
jgi:hypothetical protein